MPQRFSDTLHRLHATIEARKAVDPSSSYTAKLLAEGVERAAKKFGEEAVELVIAAAGGNPKAVEAEAADVIYHWLVLMASSGVSLDQVAAELEAREGKSGLEEKASRQAD
jgi:phosphoribosyl-ATP pyrophosphohydrolase